MRCMYLATAACCGVFSDAGADRRCLPSFYRMVPTHESEAAENFRKIILRRSRTTCISRIHNFLILRTVFSGTCAARERTVCSFVAEPIQHGMRPGLSITAVLDEPRLAAEKGHLAFVLLECYGDPQKVFNLTKLQLQSGIR